MSILLQADEANEINDTVKKEISPNLFIFCNYEPTPSKITKDIGGLFLLRISNFYKLLVDSGWIIKKFAYIYSGQERVGSSSLPFAKRDIDNIYYKLNDLRTGFCHNVSRNNGDNIIINHINEWFNRHKLNDSIDYQNCVRHIDNYAKKVIDVCKHFINCIKIMPDADREAAIGRWKSIIIEHYTKKHDIFINMLGNYYLVKNAQPDPQDLYYFKQTTVNRIILSYFTYDFEQLLDRIKQLPAKNPKKLNPIINFINDTKKKRAYDLFNKEDSDLLYPNKECEKEELINLFFEKELKNVINDILKNVPDCSLLPQCVFNEVFDKTETQFEAFKSPFKRFNI